MTITRRDCGKGLPGIAALASGAGKSVAQESAIPPQGIGQHFRHLGTAIWADGRTACK